MRFIGTMKLVRKPSLRSTLPRSGGKPSVMFLRLPPKKLTKTRLPGMVPGMSSKTKQGALSSCGAPPPTTPMSCCHESPLTSLTSPSLRASSSHSRKSSYSIRGAMLEEEATITGLLTGFSSSIKDTAPTIALILIRRQADQVAEDERIVGAHARGRSDDIAGRLGEIKPGKAIGVVPHLRMAPHPELTASKQLRVSEQARHGDERVSREANRLKAFRCGLGASPGRPR